MMMPRLLFVVFSIYLIGGAVGDVLVGGKCITSDHCKAAHSRCERGICVCEPYYAKANESSCLESTLLGSECVVSEQCSLKVAYSACLEGVCRCTDGHLQFRKHTCLSPALPGHVCYSNEHCRLWDRESHCEFVIQNLFGRCACNQHYRQVGENCMDQRQVLSSEPVVAEEDSVVVESSNTTIPNREIGHKIPRPTSNLNPGSEDPFGTGNDIIDTNDAKPSKVPFFTRDNEVVTQEDNPLKQLVSKVPNVDINKRPVRKESDNIAIDEMTASLHANDQPVYRVVTQPSIEKKSNKNRGTSKAKPHKTSHQKKSSLKDSQRTTDDTTVPVNLEPASLGTPCIVDTQCQSVDIHSRCVNKRCDCAYRTNSTSACSARNRQCLPGTFQCRSTGNCISWYFVCDGRKDCPDGSDETCQGTGKDGTGERCPMHAFRCGGPGSRCVSRASRCDGTPQCPGGEDEKNCRATKRKGCPRHTFRCASGECLPEYEFCNAVISCKDASDEPPHLCNEQSRWRAADFCPLRCGNGRCRSTAVACSGRDGCGDNSDEIACTVCRCPAPPSPAQ